MTHRRPVSAQAYNDDQDGAPTPWSDVQAQLEDPDTTGSWTLATTRPDGRPHVAPVLMIWVDGDLFFSASPTTRKAKNLAASAACVVATSTDRFDVVIEGVAEKVEDDARLERVANAFTSRYGWPVTVSDRALHGEGAPTAGPPPYDVYTVTPNVMFGFPLDEESTPTRWRPA